MVLNTLEAQSFRPEWARTLARFHATTPASRRRVEPGPVLCLWPFDPAVIELGERIAFDTALCVVAGSQPITWWVAKAQATLLVPSDEPQQPSVSGEVAEELDRLVFIGGRNGFIRGLEKQQTIRALQRLSQLEAPPTPDAILQYVLSTGTTHANGAKRLAQWYREVLEGKKHRDLGGRRI